MKVAILADFPLHVIPEFGERFRPPGHYATWLPQLAGAFENCPALDAHWITLNQRLDSLREVRWKNQTFHVIPTTPTGRAKSFFAADRKAIQACLDAIRPDLVHGWGNEDVYGFAAVTSGRRNIVSLQGILSYYVLKNWMAPRDYFQTMIELFVLHKADRISVESQWGRDVVLHRNSKARIEVVEYGVNDIFLDKKWNPDPEKPVAIFIGTITPRKGIQDAVEAFRDSALSNAELWVVGDCGGRWAEQLRASAPANVKWLGRHTTEAIANLLCEAWCMVLPTRADTSPNVVKEARVIGLPVVSTPYGGQTSYIKNGESGFLVEPGNIKDLTIALRELLSDFSTATAMGRCHQEEHRRVLHPNRTAENFLNLYRSMISHDQ